MSSLRAQTPPEADSTGQVRTRLFSVDEYHRMIDADILGEDDHVELLEGTIVEMSPQSELHARVIARLNRALIRQLGDEFQVRPQLPLTFVDSEPEPDLAVVRSGDAASAAEHPTRALLVVESSGGSLAYDRSVKARVYAGAGIPEYWIVNLRERCVEVHRDPERETGRYRSVVTVGAGESLSPVELPGFSLVVGSLFD